MTKSNFEDSQIPNFPPERHIKGENKIKDDKGIYSFLTTPLTLWLNQITTNMDETSS